MHFDVAETQAKTTKRKSVAQIDHALERDIAKT